MKKISLYLSLSLLGLFTSMQAFAVPLRLDENNLKAASMLVSKEQRAAQAAQDPAMTKVEGFCRKMTGFRMGSGYDITVTDRLAPKKDSKELFYSVVGNAEPKNKAAHTISYKCRVLLKESGDLELTEFKLFEVEEASTAPKKDTTQNAQAQNLDAKAQASPKTSNTSNK